MKNVAAVVLALGMVACGGNSRTTDGGITIDDTGGRDAGSTPTDTGGGGTCNLLITATSFGALGGACVPRCSAATATAVMACTTATCLQGALDADTTPAIAWQQNGMASTEQLDCAGCYSIQILHCLSTSGCANEVTAFISCTATDCSAQETALNTCQTTNSTAFQACAGGAGGVPVCFGG